MSAKTVHAHENIKDCFKILKQWHLTTRGVLVKKKYWVKSHLNEQI